MASWLSLNKEQLNEAFKKAQTLQERPPKLLLTRQQYDDMSPEMKQWLAEVLGEPK